MKTLRRCHEGHLVAFLLMWGLLLFTLDTVARAQLKGTAELILANKSQALVVSASKRWVVLVDLPTAKTWELKGASITIDADGRVTLVGKEYGGYIVPTKLAGEGKTEYAGEWFRRLKDGKTEQHKLTGLAAQ